MITMSYEALVAIIAMCCAAGYIIATDIHTKK